ncbi:MAG: hypothetical protein KDE26_32225, partial [Bacteroidetes bacterium]|nr:hypothetical protein [Bacteroidota bacterium]
MADKSLTNFTKRAKAFFAKRKLLSFFLIYAALSWMILILVNVLFPLPEEKPYSQTVMAADSSLLCAYLTPDEKWRMHTSLDEVNPEMVKA